MSKEEKWEVLCQTAAQKYNKELEAETYRNSRLKAQAELRTYEESEMTK